ncbi:uncharacterized protein LOC120325627 [Styela clava]|uniref:F-box/LRR-repeat protein 15-like n=1 Tax=Styela clava TaxID=7725 RepID=UPI0019393D5A|nr:F-box/LRR-repeat protein 15-like [Styela clava]
MESNLLESLPRHDVLYHNVFKYLSMIDLFRLRAVCRQLHNMMEEYFSQCHHIHIKDSDGIADATTFEILTKSNSSLRTIVIPNIGDWIDDNLLVPVINDCPNLSILNLSQCKGLTNRSLCILGMYCENLTHLRLKGCTWVDHDNFMVFISNNRKLKLLDLQKCSLLDDECVEFMSKCCPNLEYLNISEINQLTDQSLDAIAKNCRKLKHLDIIECWKMTDSGVKIIKEYCQELETLNCEHCTSISEDTLEPLRVRGVSVDIQGRLEITLRRLEHVIDYLSPLVRQLNHNL